jgi:DNA repair protein RadA/Sms
MRYACTACGYATARWLGFCPQCRKSGALVERTVQAGQPVPIREALAAGPAPRVPVGLSEVDRVLGGGLVDGSVILLGGEPGVGKSTLLLQIGAACAAGADVLYVSGEESAAQVGLRASRIGADAERLLVLAETDLGVIIAAVTELRPSLIVVDSIQTTSSSDVDGSSGGVTQVRECGARLSALARETGVPVVLVGHVTKDGTLAGPRVLEHIVDAVLYLEGDPTRGLRYLRSIKNRYGSVDQVGVFEMTELGLDEVADPTGLFVDGWTGGVPGTVVFPALYGRRSLLVEVQALVASSPAPQPRRSVKGVEAARVHQILAVLDRHADVSCAERDVYVNVVGGLTLRDPAADLAVALAIASSRVEVALGSLAAFGEVGLAGEVRAASHANRRGSEVERFGIQRVVTGGEVDRIGAALVCAGITAARSVRLAAPA